MAFGRRPPSAFLTIPPPIADQQAFLLLDGGTIWPFPSHDAAQDALHTATRYRCG